MKEVKLQFSKNEKGRYVADITLPGRVNVFVRLKEPGSIEAFAVTEGLSEPVKVGSSDYCCTPVLDINLIAGITIRLSAWKEPEEVVVITEEDS